MFNDVKRKGEFLFAKICLKVVVSSIQFGRGGGVSGHLGVLEH